MRKTMNVGKEGLPTTVHKDNLFTNQMQIVFAEFNRQPQTMKEVEVRTGIDRANICRYVREWRKAGTIAQLQKVHCPITKHLAYKRTTNPKFFPKPQPTLFDGMEGRQNDA